MTIHEGSSRRVDSEGRLYVTVYVLNFDRTYPELTKIKNFLAKQVKERMGFRVIFDIELKDADISQLDVLSRDLMEKKYDLAILVVHAHESRLCINQPGAGIGYTPVYNALKMCTDNRVVVMVGADDHFHTGSPLGYCSEWVDNKLSGQLNAEEKHGQRGLLLSWNNAFYNDHIVAMANFLHDYVLGLTDDDRNKWSETHSLGAKKPNKIRTGEVPRDENEECKLISVREKNAENTTNEDDTDHIELQNFDRDHNRSQSYRKATDHNCHSKTVAVITEQPASSRYHGSRQQLNDETNPFCSRNFPYMCHFCCLRFNCYFTEPGCDFGPDDPPPEQAMHRYRCN